MPAALLCALLLALLVGGLTGLAATELLGWLATLLLAAAPGGLLPGGLAAPLAVSPPGALVLAAPLAILLSTLATRPALLVPLDTHLILPLVTLLLAASSLGGLLLAGLLLAGLLRAVTLLAVLLLVLPTTSSMVLLTAPTSLLPTALLVGFPVVLVLSSSLVVAGIPSLASSVLVALSAASLVAPVSFAHGFSVFLRIIAIAVGPADLPPIWRGRPGGDGDVRTE